MRYELKEFQETAARELLDNMTYLMEGYTRHGKIGSCCLAAPTGSGKTVIAATVIEAIMEGSAEFGVEADPEACVLWVTDLPSLADQTKYRLLDATDLDQARIESITNTFTQNHTQLEAGQVYFLHRQLLGKGRKLTGGGESLSFWQVLRDSIASGLHLYLFLDEAHRGLDSGGKKASGDETIYAQIIDGENGNSPIPVVVGISATPKRFLEAMANRKGRTSEAPTTVAPADVQASGLLKDDIILRAPVTSTAAAKVYLGDACAALKDITQRWAGWCALNNVVPAVNPLMVVQVKDKASDAELTELIKDIRGILPDLATDAFAHVFGDHTDRHLAGIEIPYLSPEAVENATEVKVLLAKEAVSTGWDCPRAEVIYSMRPHKDTTYITQLLGRMVRTPLAMRVDDGVLNGVRCFLPEFDDKSVQQVVGYLTSEDSADWSGISADSGRNVIVDPAEVSWDHGLGVDEAFESIKRVIESHHPTEEIKAALEYSTLLARYDIDRGAHKEILNNLLKELRAGIHTFADEYEKAYKEVSKVTSNEYHMQYLMEDSVSTTTLVQAADAFAVRNARKRADDILTEALTNKFFAGERGRHKSDLDTNAVIAAAASVPQIVDRVKTLARSELDRIVFFYRQTIDGLDEPARMKFASVLSANGIHREENLRIIENDTQDKVNVKFFHHVLNDPQTGEAWIKLDSAAEQDVVNTELKRENCKGFYRNPPNGVGSHVLGIVYQHPNGGHRNMHPDFIFFEEVGGKVMPSIIDPHGTHLPEARAKLEGLAKYAQRFGEQFARIWAINGDGTRLLDMKDKEIQNALISGSDNVEELYKKFGFKYN